MQNNEFDPNSAGIDNGNFFGLPFGIEDAKIVLIPVPWDVTTSYRTGTSNGPEAIMEASLQIDLYDADFGNTWQNGIACLPDNKKIKKLNKKFRKKAESIIKAHEKGKDINTPELATILAQVNKASETLNHNIYENAIAILNKNKIPGVVGGEHSVPYGHIKALSEKYLDFGILHIDAHADLRQAYEGFEFSHASIMFNALKLPNISKILQIAIRDYSEQEKALAEQSEKIEWYNDSLLFEKQAQGISWATLCQEIVKKLPEKVYLSFDIDGLDPGCCPSTGTPVPGGLSFNQAVYLLKELKQQNKTIIGFDLCEVSPGTPDDIDAIYGARLLFKICSLILDSFS